MSKNNLLNRGIILIVVVLFFGANVTYSIDENSGTNSVVNAGDTIISSESDASTLRTASYDGSLSGYVNNDTSMNPIAGARVRVYFHETYEENYSNSSGYYHVTNIPICYCLKNATCSKEGYRTEWVLLGIDENTTHDFVLVPLDSPCYPIFNGTMGWNGWFVSCVTVTFIYNPEEISAVYYKVDGGSWQNYSISFDVCTDGVHKLCWFYVDNNGNQSDVECIDFKIDQTPPEIYLWWEAYKEGGIWWILFTAIVEDACSGMNRVEFHLNDILQETIVGPGPTYEWVIPLELENYSVIGFICNRKITEENVSFFALIVWQSTEYSFVPWEDTVKAMAYDNAGNWDYDDTWGCSPPGPWGFFTHFTFRNNYEGYIGRFFINAIFEKGPLETTLPCEIE